MRRLLFIIVLSILSSYALPTHAQIIFRKFDASTSLLDNNVKNMVMLPNGVIYLESPARLSMFDGVSTVNLSYGLQNIPHIEYNGINCLYHDSQNRIWLKNRDNIWIYNIETESYKYDINTVADNLNINCKIDNIVIIDRDKYLFYDKTQHTIFYYNDTDKSCAEIEMPDIMGDFISAKFINGSFWILCDNGMLAQWDESTKSIEYVEQHLFANNEQSNKRSRLSITSDNQGVLWIATDKNIICYDTSKYRLGKKIDIQLDESDIFTSIAFDTKGQIWIGSSRSGIRIIDNIDFSIEHLPYLEVVEGHNIDHSSNISHIYVDHHGGVWVATATDGLLYHHKDIFKLKSINNSTISSGTFKNQSIKSILKEPEGTLLLGTMSGLYRYDPSSNSVTTPYPELIDKVCIELYRDNDNRVWVGTLHNGAYCIDQDKIKHYFYPDMPDIDTSYRNSTPNLNSFSAFYQMPDGRVYASVYGDIGVINEQTGEIELTNLVQKTNNPTIRGITPLSDNKLLLNGENGFLIYDTSNNLLDNKVSLPRNHGWCYDLIIDSRGLFWTATLSGIYVYDPVNKRQRLLSTNQGITDVNIMSVTEDNFGNIWITTSAGIYTIKMRHDWSIDDIMIVRVSPHNGIPNTSFFQQCSTLGPDGNLYFGSSNGLYVVDPSAFINTTKSSAPMLLNLRLHNNLINVGGKFNGREILSKPLNEASHLTLRHDESFVTFEFSGLNYSNPSHTRYRYILEGFNQDWVEIHNANDIASATFSLLHPGKYTFKVQSACNGSWWSSENAQIELTILPPWWQSSIAIMVYVMLLLVAIYLIIWFITDRNIKQTLLKQKIEEEARKAGMEEMKLHFFVNVSHELRTPLSLIIIPLESLLNKLSDQSIRPQLETMHRNAKGLLQLVNHLLDFRKIDMGQEKLKPNMGDMYAFVESIYESFKAPAEINNIRFTFECNYGKLPMSFDHSMMHKIVNNLLSNAMKFTPKDGSITLSLDQVECSESGNRFVVIKVVDTGHGIPQSDLDFIFDRFFQASNNRLTKGTGIGLNLSQSYAELHGGKITVESSIGQGSTFTVRIPMDIKSEEIEPAATDVIERESDDPLVESTTTTPTTPTSPKELNSNDGERYKLLIVEDNKDFRDYMASELQEIYDITTAENGRQGLEAIKECMPDLITSDVMMPEMDGMELCRTLKNNIETSHIPIILLTAQSSDESRLTSYESGADAFVSKPFHWGVLHARIRNLIEERKSRVQEFNNDTTDSDLEALTLSPLDLKFIRRAIESIDRNLDNTEYSVEMMSDDLSMNRMSIYRKFKSIMEQTPGDFIRTIRLKRAAKWIESGKGRGYSLVEISEMFGFNTPKYFSKYFKEIYGETPMQYVSRFK